MGSAPKPNTRDKPTTLWDGSFYQSFRSSLKLAAGYHINDGFEEVMGEMWRDMAISLVLGCNYKLTENRHGLLGLTSSRTTHTRALHAYPVCHSMDILSKPRISM